MVDVDVQIANDIYVDFVADNHATVNIVEETINVVAGLAGPAGSGHGILLTDYAVKTQFLTWNTGVGSINMDLGNIVHISVFTSTTISNITGWPGIGEEGKLTLYVQQRGGVGTPATLVWPGSIKWVNTDPPQLQPDDTEWDVFSLTSSDSGTTVFGFHVGRTLTGAV